MHIQQLGGIYNITTFLALFTSAVVTVIVIKIVAYKRRIFIVAMASTILLEYPAAMIIAWRHKFAPY